MLLHSTINSLKSPKVSILAVIESILAISVSFLIAWKYETVLFVIISTLIAPFLLLRTEYSIKLSLKILEYLGRSIKNNITSDNGFSALALFMLMYFGGLVVSVVAVVIFGGGNLSYDAITQLAAIMYVLVYILLGLLSGIAFVLQKFELLATGGEVALKLMMNLIFTLVSIGAFVIPILLIKFLVSVYAFILHPILSLQQLPRNWYEIVFCVNVLHPPEILSGIEETDSLLKFSNWFKVWVKNESKIDNFFGWFLYITTFPFIFFPALVYRWSLKSSALIWLPLIYVIGFSKEKTEVENILSLKNQLEACSKTAIAKTQFYYAIFSIIVLTLIPLVMSAKAKELLATNMFPLINYIFAFQMDAWHWTRLIAGVLTIGLFFYADSLLAKRKNYESAGENIAPLIIRSVKLFRFPLSLFTLSAFFYILYTTIDWHQQFENMKWFPYFNN